MRMIVLGSVIACVFASNAFATNKEVTMRDKQQAACAQDVQRLCPDAMLDEAKATACMKDKRSQVSATCAKMYDTAQ
jgi:hypothetical protein